MFIHPVRSRDITIALIQFPSHPCQGRPGDFSHIELAITDPCTNSALSNLLWWWRTEIRWCPCQHWPSTAIRVRSASGRSSRQRTSRRRSTFRRFRLHEWSLLLHINWLGIHHHYIQSHPGSWSPWWHGGTWIPCIRIPWIQWRAGGSSRRSWGRHLRRDQWQHGPPEYHQWVGVEWGWNQVKRTFLPPMVISKYTCLVTVTVSAAEASCNIYI